MKKLFIVLVISIIAIALCSCGGSDDSEDYTADEDYAVEEYEDDELEEEEESYEEYLDRNRKECGHISAKEAIDHVGEKVIVTDFVRGVSVENDVNGRPIFINLGEDYPSEDRCTLIIWDTYRAAFEKEFDIYNFEDPQEPISVEGTVTEYDGIAQIELTDVDQIGVPAY